MKITISDPSCGFLIEKGTFRRMLLPGTYHIPFWKNAEVKQTVMKGKVEEQGIPMERLMENQEVSKRVLRTLIPDGSIGYRFVNGVFEEVLLPGEYYFWNVYETQEFHIVDVSSPDIEPDFPVYLIEKAPASMYRKITVEEGEIRTIMNTVLIAEKQAQANVITRREEVASTRSLLNTAKLMEENKILYRLKEMEYLEKICEKVGSISLSGGNGILGQLAELTKGSE